MAEYEDMEIVCVDCKKPFIFEAGEQKFFAEKGFTPPKRCKPCRDERKAQRNGGGRSQRRDSQPQHADDFGSAFGEVWEEDHKQRRRRRRRD